MLDGNGDGIFRECSEAEPLAGVAGDGAHGYAPDVKQLFPAARKFAFHLTPNTGHCINLHRTAQESFHAAHAFLVRVGF